MRGLVVGLMRALIRMLPTWIAIRLDRLMLQLHHELGDHLRRLASRRAALPELTSHDGGERLRASVVERGAPWTRLEIKTHDAVPGMISREESQYYAYIGRFHSGAGAAVELGTWLGRSTAYILDGLADNPRFEGPLHVYDDYVWRASWMDRFVDPERRMASGESFLPWFEELHAERADRLRVVPCRIATEAGVNEHQPPLSWDGGPVELLYVDCGRQFAVNQAWWQVFQPHLIPGRSLIAMQDWRLHREVPERWENQTLQFTDSKGGALQLVHEVSWGSIATFLYLGEAGAS